MVAGLDYLSERGDLGASRLILVGICQDGRVHGCGILR